jgi:hypothetical protein
MNIQFKINKAGFRDIRYRNETRSMLEAVARTVADTANSTFKPSGPSDRGYEVFSRAGARKPYGRWRTGVVAVGPHANRHNAVHNTLVKALG